MRYSIYLIFLGIIRWSLGIDLIAFAFLYFLVSEKNFGFREVLEFIFWAEVCSSSWPGLYLLSFFAIYLLHNQKKIFFQANLFFDFAFFILGYLFIRVVWNLPFLLEYNISIRNSASYWISTLLLVGSLFWTQFVLEKCLAKFIKFS
jgi:hypothetical protein